MGLDLKEIKDIKKTIDKLDDKIPEDVKKKAKDLATKENIEKVKDIVEDKLKKDSKDKDKKDKKK